MKDRAVKVDLEWDDTGIVPEVVSADTEFVFIRMTEATLRAAAVERGVVLDIGCGLARDTVELAVPGAQVIGLEPSMAMIDKARAYMANGAGGVALIQSIGEELPFRMGSVDCVICKGALDHFYDPSKTLEEISRVLKPGGKAVISIANFDSLSCRLSRVFHKATRLFFRGSNRDRMMWQIPPDHTYKFDYTFLKKLVAGHLRIEKATGVSLLWGLPLWGLLLSGLPRMVSWAILSVLDKLASRWPTASDVIIVSCRPW